ncbi:MAG: hypothetical protein K0U93_10490 [Gammaproteobacteria bacterium]|nr:hypothetical protein [Gammaproteobacteria bacterium]
MRSWIRLSLQMAALCVAVLVGTVYLTPGWLAALCFALAAFCVDASRRANVVFNENRRISQ